MDKIKVMSVFGTRPEAIKMAPLVKQLEQTEEIESIVCVTAQHRQMLDQVLEIFHLRPHYDLDIMQARQTLSGITTRALTGLEDVMAKEKPDLVLVHGDTSTTFAGALAAYYNQIKVGHVEAGLRTYDKYQPFPEEMNRKLTGALTDLHFAPTPLAKEHLLKENVSADSVFITGNTVIDALSHTIQADYTFAVDELNYIDYANKRIIAMTAHRRENLGEPLENICNAIKRIVLNYPDVEVVYAVHKNPAVMEVVVRILGNLPRVHLTEPLDLKDMHNLMCRSYLVLTDSGGLQEEVPSMGKPVLVLRNVTERPEGVEAGTLKLAGTDEQTIYTLTKELLDNEAVYAGMASARNPFGDGEASRRIVENILYAFGKRALPADEYDYKKILKEATPMKDERMAILNMLANGTITADEAERLLTVLNKGVGMDTSGISKGVNTVLEKTGSTINNVAKSVGEQAEKLQPKVKEFASIVSEKAEEYEPSVRQATFRVAEILDELKGDIRNYYDKMKDKKDRDSADTWSEDDFVDLSEDDFVHDNTKKIVAPDAEEEAYAKNVESVLNSLQQQMNQLNDAENFLRASFGDEAVKMMHEEETKVADVQETAKELIDESKEER